MVQTLILYARKSPLQGDEVIIGAGMLSVSQQSQSDAFFLSSTQHPPYPVLPPPKEKQQQTKKSHFLNAEGGVLGIKPGQS